MIEAETLHWQWDTQASLSLVSHQCARVCARTDCASPSAGTTPSSWGQSPVVAYSAVREAALAAARRTGRRDTWCGPSGLGSCTRGDDCTHGDAAASSTASGVSSAPESPPVDQGSGEGEFRSISSWAAAAAEAALTSSAVRRLASAVPRFLRTSFTPHALHSVLGPARGVAGDVLYGHRSLCSNYACCWPSLQINGGKHNSLARKVHTAGTFPPLRRAGGAALRACFGAAVGSRQAGRRNLPRLRPNHHAPTQQRCDSWADWSVMTCD